MTREANSATRLRWLVGVHLFLSAAPLLVAFVKFELIYLPLIWASYSIPFGSLMTLSVWVGIGQSRLVWRVLGAFAAAAYAALVIALGMALQMMQYGEPFVINATSYLQLAAVYVTFVIVFGGMFRLFGHRYELRRVERHEVALHPARFQFTVFHGLVIMAVVALVLTLLRASRSDIAASGPFSWTTHDALGALVFFLNMMCAAYAALWPGGVKRNVGLVMVVSVLLGIVLAFAMHHDESQWWLLIGGMFIAIIPTLIEVASLLVVRSCGYRLVRRGAVNI